MDLSAAKMRIINQVPLRDLVGGEVDLQRRSGRYVGLCPFHNEKSPSFTLYDNHYYCFGCKASGDAIDYVRKTLGLGFIEALKHLAEKFNIEAPELHQSKTDFDGFKRRSELLQIMNHAHAFFKGHLSPPRHQFARGYLNQRGFTSQNIEDFGFGYAPDSFHALSDHLLSMGYSIDQLIDTSLSSGSQKAHQGCVDFFRNRLMIPIQDPSGNVIAFGGRSLSQDPAKYINSRESRLYDKSQVVFGYHRAKDFMRRRNRCLLTEGYMDTLKLWAKGLDESVACLGTALTLPQLRIMASQCTQVYLIFDGDQAGQIASLRAVTIALEVPDVGIKVVGLPPGEDPDTFVSEQGVEALEALIDQAQGLLDFAVQSRLRQSDGLSIPKVVSDEFIPWLAKVQDPIQQSYLSQKISLYTGIDHQTIRAHIARLKWPEAARFANPTGPEVSTISTESRSGASRLNTDSEKATPVSYKLSSLDQELVGFLLTTPIEEHAHKELIALCAELEWPEALLELVNTVLNYASMGQPALDHPEFKAAAICQHPSIVKLIDKVRLRRAAFVLDEPSQKRLDKLIAAYRKTNLQNQRQRLKQLLQGTPLSQQLDILKEINEINRSLNQFSTKKF